MGRGKGFSVISRESGIDDRDLARALKPKLLDLVSVLVAHGHITRTEIVESAGAEDEVHRVEVPSPADGNLRSLGSELTAEKETRAFLEREVRQLQLGLRRLLKQWHDAERRDAISQRRIDELRARTEHLVAATREGVESLQRLRTELRNADRGAKELADHVRKMRAIVEAVQALRAPQKPEPGEPRAAHDAR